MSFDLKNVIGGSFLLVCAVSAATWWVASTVHSNRIKGLEDTVAGFENIKETNLPDLINNLSEIASDANANIKLEKLQKEYSKLQSSYNSVYKQNEELLKSSKLEEEFQLLIGQSHTILNGYKTVGVMRINDNYASINFDNNSDFWNVGEVRKLEYGGRIYELILSSIQDNRVTFRLIGKDK